MKSLSIALIVTCGCLTVSSAAFAYRYPPRYNSYRDYPNPYNPVARDSFYIAGDFGLGLLSTPSDPLISPDSVFITEATANNESIAAGGAIGYRHAVGRNFLVGGEFGYDYNGTARYKEVYHSNDSQTESTTYKISSQDLHLLATGTVLFNSGFNIFAKGGTARVEQKLKVSNQVSYTNIPIFLGETSITGYKPMAAAGIGYQFKAVDIYAQYSHIFGIKADSASDLFNANGFTDIVSVDTFKIGMAINIRV